MAKALVTKHSIILTIQMVDSINITRSQASRPMSEPQVGILEEGEEARL
jgi:hypothetical protein